MKVLHIITGLAAGGAEQQLRLLLRRQQGRAEVATLTNPGLVAQAIRGDGTLVHEIGMRGQVDGRALVRLARLIRAGRFDLVHTHLYRANLYGRLAARLAGVRAIVATEHSLGERHIEGRRTTAPVRALYLASERLGTVTVAVSQTVAGRLVGWGLPRSRVVVIPNAVEPATFRFRPDRRDDLRARLGLPGDRFVVGTLGRLVPGKRFELVVRALAGLAPVSLLMVGDGPQRGRLIDLAAASGVDLVVAGESAEVPSMLSAMDLLVAPSAEETFGLAVVEALASGLPVYYTSCPALDDLPDRMDATLPQAVRLRSGAGVDAWRAALGHAIRAGPVRHPPPAALARFDAGRLAARLDQLYTAVATARAGTVAKGQRRHPWLAQ